MPFLIFTAGQKWRRKSKTTTQCRCLFSGFVVWLACETTGKLSLYLWVMLLLTCTSNWLFKGFVHLQNENCYNLLTLHFCTSFFLLLNTNEDIGIQTVDEHYWPFHSRKKILWKPMLLINCLDTNNSPNIFSVQQNKEKLIKIWNKWRVSKWWHHFYSGSELDLQVIVQQPTSSGMLESLSNFKQQLKTHLFQLYLTT